MNGLILGWFWKRNGKIRLASRNRLLKSLGNEDEVKVDDLKEILD